MDNEAVNTVEEIEEESENQPEAESAKEREAREKREAEARIFRAKKRRLIPPFVMLLAGAAASITMRLQNYDTKSMLVILLCVLFVFYIAGCFLKSMVDQFERQVDEAVMEEGEVVEKELVEESKTSKKRSPSL